jgi:DNA-binding transcriptional regulator YiaG
MLVARSLGDLVDLPGNGEALMRTAAGRGVKLVVTTLDRASAPEGVLAAIAAFGHLEAELARTSKELAAVQEVAERRYERALHQAAIQMQENLPEAMATLRKGVEPLGPVTDQPEHLGSAVRQEREKRGMSQRDLAELAGVNQATVSKVEGGSTAGLKPIMAALWPQEGESDVAA